MKSLQEIYFSNLNAVCNTGGAFFCPIDFSWQIDSHTFNQNKFYFITDGKCSITINGREYIARAGQWFFIPAGMLHAYHNLKDCSFEKYWMHFDLYPSADLFSMLDLPFVVDVPQDSAAYDLFRRAVAAMKNDSLTDRLYLKTCLLMLIAEYIGLVYPEGVAVEDTDSRIDQILRYINGNLDKTLSVKEMAAQLSGFSRKRPGRHLPAISVFVDWRRRKDCWNLRICMFWKLWNKSVLVTKASFPSSSKNTTLSRPEITGIISAKTYIPNNTESGLSRIAFQD